MGPLITNKNSKNGTMKIAYGSQKRIPFLEYQKDKFSSHQQQVPEVYLKILKNHLKLNFGDVSFMHSNTVHQAQQTKQKLFQWLWYLNIGISVEITH